MWTTIYVSTEEKECFKISEFLSREGFIVKINDFSNEMEANSFEVLVLRNEADYAKDLLIEIGMI